MLMKQAFLQKSYNIKAETVEQKHLLTALVTGFTNKIWSINVSLEIKKYITKIQHKQV